MKLWKGSKTPKLDVAGAIVGGVLLYNTSDEYVEFAMNVLSIDPNAPGDDISWTDWVLMLAPFIVFSILVLLIFAWLARKIGHKFGYEG